VRDYINGNGSFQSIARKYGVGCTPFRKWVAKYKAQGEIAFINNGRHNSYSSAFKEMVVQSYLHGEGSLQDVAIKYKIPSQDTVRQWVLKYNGHEELKTSGTGGTIMIKGRKTTFEERIDIVSFCITNKYNYQMAADKFKVSYQQVYTWTKKYEINGSEALTDSRGKRKHPEEMDENQKLAAQLKLLEAENKRLKLENDFLKKLDEVERRR